MKRLLFAILVLLLAISALPGSAAASQPQPRVLARGAALHGTNGIMFDRHDRLHIASVAGREVVVMNPQTGAVLDRLGPDQGVEGPDDLTFGPDGALYWTSFFTGVVGRRAPDGTVSTVAQLPPGVGAITFSDDGRLFVAVSFPGVADALYELDPSAANPPRLIAENLGGLNAMDWGSDGLLYGPLQSRGQVVRINVDTGAVAPVAGGFGLPTAAKFDSRGRLHVVDQLSGDKRRGEVIRVNIATGAKTVIARLPAGLDNLAFDSHDRLFVSSFQDGFIAEIKPDGEVRMVSGGGMILPGGVAALPRGRDGESVFVADLFSLRELDAWNGHQRSIERGFPGSSELISPVFTVAPDGGRLLLSSPYGMVQIWDPVAHAPVATYFDFAGPLNAIRFQGDLVVAELGSGSVVRARGANPAERVTLAAGLGVPAGLAATEDDLWVGDRATGRILQLVADGQPLAPPRVVAAELSAPEGLAVAPDHSSLLVVESGAGRLVRIELATGRLSMVADGLALGAQGIPDSPLVPPTWSFNGVAVGRSGTIYVSGDKANVLYSLD